jgi:tetratricopeptide (TPR) repeat protein
VLAGLLLLSCSGPEEKKMKFFGRGKAHYEKGDYVKASLEFRNAIQIDPKYADAYYMLGMSQFLRGDLGGAFGSLKRAVDLDPRHLPAQAQLGKLLLSAGQRDEAMGKAEEVLKTDPESEDALLLKAGVLLAAKESVRARAHLEEMIGKKTRQPDAYLLLATVCMRQKDARCAENALMKGLQSHSRSLPLHRALADFYVEEGRNDEAASRVREVISLEPANYGNTITLAGLYWATGKEPKAREVLKTLSVERAEDESCRLDLASFYARRGDAAEAERELSEGIRRNAKSFRMRLALAELYGVDGRTDNAVAVLKECLSFTKDPANPEIVNVKNALARIHIGRQELDRAGALLEEVLAAVPRNADAHLVKGSLHMLKGDGAGAVAEFRAVVGDKPQFLQGHLLLAEAHLLKKETNLALETLQNALKANPKSRDVLRALGRFHAVQKDIPKAEEILGKILSEDPADVEVVADLGDLYAAAGDEKRAEEKYASIRRAAPKSTLGDIKLVGLYMKQKKHAAAVKTCEERIRRNDGRDAFAWNLLGEVYREQGNAAKAEESYLAAVKADPDVIPTYLQLGRLYSWRKEYRKAIQVYETVLRKQPRFWPAANDLAMLLCDHGNAEEDLDRALLLAENARRNRPEDPILLDTLGWIRCRKGDLQQALELLQRARGKLGGNPEVSYHLGMALYKAGQKDQARERLREAAAFNGDFHGKDEAVRALKEIGS